MIRYTATHYREDYYLLYQDPSILVVDKAPGLLTVPGRLPENKYSLQNLLLKRFPNSRIVHRLDQPTSGLLIIPQSQSALSHIAKQFQSRTVTKRYQAVVNGLILSASGTVNQPLMCDWPNRPKQMIDPQGKPAETQFRVLERDEQFDKTRVALFPVTGRSHQLRVHMAHLGHAILGDRLYADSLTVTKSPCLMLHAEQITFRHPKTNVQMTFTQPLRHWSDST